jgi:hypothetical protein
MANVTVTFVPPTTHSVCITLDSDNDNDHDENVQPGAESLTLNKIVDKPGTLNGDTTFQNRLMETDSITMNENKTPFEIGVVWKIPIRWKCGLCTTTAT